MHPLLVLSECNVGGSRGIFALGDISVGTLLSEEEPYEYVDEATDYPLHVQITRHLLHSNDYHLFPDLHPIDISILATCDLERAEKEHKNTIDDLQKDFGHISPSILLRTLLVVQFNAFSTGLYHTQSMINHNCKPNCTKSIPVGQTCSHIVANRDIKAGEEITIHYAPPLERSWRNRHRILDQQHYFQLSPSPFPVDIDGELSEIQSQCVDEIELRMDENEINLEKALSILQVAQNTLPKQHLVITRALKIVLQELLKVLEETGAYSVALKALEFVLEVRKRQAVYLSPLDLEIAATAEDLEQLLSFLLCNAPTELFTKFPAYNSYALASKQEYLAKKQKDTIRMHYKLK